MREIIDQAVLNARAVKSPTDRLYIYGQIADKLIDLGEKERRKLLAEAEELAGPTVKGNKTGFNLGIVARPLPGSTCPPRSRCSTSLPRRSRKMIRVIAHMYSSDFMVPSPTSWPPMPRPTPSACQADPGGCACECQPLCIAVCSRMAPHTDLARARRIAETMFDAGSIQLRP